MRRHFDKTMFLLCVVVFFAVHAFLNLASAQSTTPAIFVTNNVGDSVTSLAIEPDGSLSFIGVFPSGEGPQAISISPNGQFIAVGHGTISSTTEELRIFEVNSDATLIPRLTTLVPDSPLDALWVSDTILAVPETDISNSTLRTYEFDSTANSLTLVDIEPVGGFATSLALSADGSRLFTNDSFGGLVSLSVDPAGEITAVDTVNTGSLFATHVALSPDDRFLYATGGISNGGNSILTYEIDGNGMFQPVPGSPFQSPGESPKVSAVTADGNVLVAGHGTDATVRSFLRDSMTGALAATPFQFDVGSQGNLGDLAIMGDLMFVTDESTADDGVAGAYSFRVHHDGSLTQLGSIVNTQGTRPEYIATWPGLLPACDIDQNGDCNSLDLRRLYDAIASGDTGSLTDLDGNGIADNEDIDDWLLAAGEFNSVVYRPGDADLNGEVSGADFTTLASNFGNEGRPAGGYWDEGNFDGQDPDTQFRVAGSDFTVLASNFGSSSLEAVPEPNVGLAMAVLASLLIRRRRAGR